MKIQRTIRSHYAEERKSCAKTQRGEEFREFEELMGMIGEESSGNSRKTEGEVSECTGVTP